MAGACCVASVRSGVPRQLCLACGITEGCRWQHGVRYSVYSYDVSPRSAGVLGPTAPCIEFHAGCVPACRSAKAEVRTCIIGSSCRCWPGWDMRSCLNGERQPRNPHLARKALSSAKLEPIKFAGDCMEWTSSHRVACPLAGEVSERTQVHSNEVHPYCSKKETNI